MWDNSASQKVCLLPSSEWFTRSRGQRLGRRNQLHLTGRHVVQVPSYTCRPQSLCKTLMCAFNTPIWRSLDSSFRLLVKTVNTEQSSWMDICPPNLSMGCVPVCDPAVPQALFWIIRSKLLILLPHPVALENLSTSCKSLVFTEESIADSEHTNSHCCLFNITVCFVTDIFT